MQSIVPTNNLDVRHKTRNSKQWGRKVHHSSTKTAEMLIKLRRWKIPVNTCIYLVLVKKQLEARVRWSEKDSEWWSWGNRRTKDNPENVPTLPGSVGQLWIVCHKAPQMYTVGSVECFWCEDLVIWNGNSKLTENQNDFDGILIPGGCQNTEHLNALNTLEQNTVNGEQWGIVL